MKNYELKIFHNNKCSKSRALIKILEDKKVNFKTINYLNEKLDISFLRETLNVLYGDISEIIRSNEELFKTKFNHLLHFHPFYYLQNLNNNHLSFV